MVTKQLPKKKIARKPVVVAVTTFLPFNEDVWSVEETIKENYPAILMECLKIAMALESVYRVNIVTVDRRLDNFDLRNCRVLDVLSALSEEDKHLPLQLPVPMVKGMWAGRWNTIMEIIDVFSDYQKEQIAKAEAEAERKKAIESLEPWQKKALGYAF